LISSESYLENDLNYAYYSSSSEEEIYRDPHYIECRDYECSDPDVCNCNAARMTKIDYEETSRNLFTQMMAGTDPQLKEMYKTLLMDHLKQVHSSLKNQPHKGYVPPATLFSVEALTRKFRNEEFGEDLPQTLPAIHQAIKELRKTMKENKKLCFENHRDLSMKMIGSQGASASRNPPLSGKPENWTYVVNPVYEEMHRQWTSEEEKEDERTSLGCNIMNRDVMYCIKMRVRIGNWYEDWKVLMDTGSRLNIVSDAVFSTHLRRPTACPRVITTSGEIETKTEAEIEVFLIEDTGVRIVCPMVPNMDCAMYLGTPFSRISPSTEQSLTLLQRGMVILLA